MKTGLLGWSSKFSSFCGFPPALKPGLPRTKRRANFADAMIDPASQGSSPTRWWIYTALAVLFVFALRVHWIDGSVSRLPFWDEIPAELVAEARRAPGELPGFAELIHPHNEHRILWQRLIAHGLVEANDRVWDSRVRAMTNAIFAALYAGLLAHAFRAGHGGRIGHLLFWPSIALVASPIAYQNMIFGFQTSFHLQMLFSIAALAGLLGSSWTKVPWWFGLAAAFAAIFTNGSGFFTAPVLLVWILLSVARRENGKWFPSWKAELRRQLPNLIAAMAILGVGLALLHRPENAGGQQASSVGEFLLGFAKHLAWPWQDKPWVAPILWSPFAALGFLTLLGRGKGIWLASARFTICLGGWLLLNLLAMAYARGAMAIGPVPRYEDFHLLGVAANSAALLLVLTEIRNRRHILVRIVPPAIGMLWGTTAISGLLLLLTEAWRIELPDYQAFGRIREQNTARFTLDGDAGVFDGYVSRFHLPYDNAAELKHWFSEPAVRALLPANFRSPAEAVSAAAREGACTASLLPEGVSVPPGERLLGSSFDRTVVGEGGQAASVTSGPISAPSGAFRLFYIGMDTGGALKLRLKPEGKGKAIPIATERRHGTSTWMPITVKVDPEKSYRLEFRDASRGGWGAVTLPTNEPRLSMLADRAGRFALPAGILVLFLILVIPARQELPRSSPESIEPSP